MARHIHFVNIVHPNAIKHRHTYEYEYIQGFGIQQKVKCRVQEYNYAHAQKKSDIWQNNIKMYNLDKRDIDVYGSF